MGFQTSVPLLQCRKHRHERAASLPSLQMRPLGKEWSVSGPQPRLSLTSVAHRTPRCLSAHCLLPQEALSQQNQSQGQGGSQTLE